MGLFENKISKQLDELSSFHEQIMNELFLRNIPSRERSRISILEATVQKQGDIIQTLLDHLGFVFIKWPERRILETTPPPPRPLTYIAVIAGNFAQFQNFLKEQSVLGYDSSRFVFISEPEYLRGRTFSHYVLYGTYFSRPDYSQIMNIIEEQSTHKRSFP